MLSELIPHTRIQKSVDNIDQQVHQQQCNCDECYDADDQRFITIKRRLDKVVAQTWKREQFFNDYRSGKQKRDKKSPASNLRAGHA